ncbi:WD40 repeat domain-containing protein [Streptomyces sp. NPDC020192]|uniref:WD40 repeat domain-containing protein n=1 Tax=Streptomyces sp. NPDC020192 TaxID=3365066 RepID=UPI0037BD4997
MSSRTKWLPGLLTSWLVVLACLTSAAVQGTLPSPWQSVAPEHGDAVQPEQWRPDTGRLGRAGTAAFTPDGRLLVTVSGSSVDTWDMADPEHPERVGLGDGVAGAGVTALGISPDGRTLVTAGTNGMRALAVGSGLPQWSFARTVGVVKALRVTGRGVLLVASGPGGPTQVMELRLDHGRPLPPVRLSSLLDAPRSAQFSPDGRILALADTAGAVRLWNLADPRHPQAAPPFTPGGEKTDGLAFSADGRLLATVNDGGTVRLWDVTVAAHPRYLGRPFTGARRVTGVAFSPDARLVATVSGDGTASLWRRRPETSAASDTGG